MDLVEREHELGVLHSAVAAAAAGEGGVVALAGDAGTGKTALLRAVVRSSTGRTAAPDGPQGGPHVLLGSCDPLSTPRPLGPLRDMAARAGSAWPDLEGDLTPAGVCDRLYAALRERPTVLVVEDLHWVDEATADVLRFLVRRIDTLPLTVLLSYRDVEIGPDHTARLLLGDLARTEQARTLTLQPLSADGVAALLGGTRLDPARVHGVTGGNPFFVTEIAKEPERPLPTSVRDAVLARAAAVSVDDLQVLQLVATAPDRLDDRVLPHLGVDLPTLRRLDATGLLVRERGGLVFRHELARRALESTVPPGGAHGLHRALLDALEQVDPTGHAVLTHHAVAARDSARAARHARAAADEATLAGSHSEAAAFLEIALKHLDDVPLAERAELLRRLSVEQYMTSRLGRAIDTVKATFPLWQRAGDPVGLATAYDSCAVFEYYNARRAEAEEHVERATAAVAPPDAPDGTDGEAAYAGARTTRAYLALMGSELDLAAAYLDEATGIADRRGDDRLALRAGLFAATARLGRGELAARADLVDHLERARGIAWDELASTAYSQLAHLDVEQRRLRDAEAVLEEGLPFSTSRDIPICSHWQTAMRSRLRLTEGRWQAALEDAGDVLGRDGMPLARLWPHLVVALVGLRTGEASAPHPDLDAGWELAGRVDEPLRWTAVTAALAEQEWLSGREDPRVRDGVALLHRVAGTPGAEWGVGELATWLVRLGLLKPDEVPEPVAPPFAAALAGRYAEAVDAWRRIGDPFTAALVAADSDEVDRQVAAVEALDAAGAWASADRVRVDLRRGGALKVPGRARAATRANPGGLTNRQLDVARLVARGHTNAEIAARLYISTKTADHHVSAVLAKLGVENRRALVVRAEDLGLA
ncbi:ATP-binding protein [Spongisporangium articulatum]|uniref:ATP-binding protein n=1 Tax=Spongisporangium articulatum TaxID=3362603 RepID=A0ABW8AQ18_9ACTN